jgi:hypothetical protein
MAVSRPDPVGVARLRLAGLACALVLVAAPPAGAATDPLDACVERNTVRYVSPGSALDAQYGDIAAACAAALDDTGAAVDFTPEPSEEDGPSQTPPPGGNAAADGESPPSGGRGDAATRGTGDDAQEGAETGRGEDAEARPSGGTRPPASSAPAVSEAAGLPGPDAGSPLPGSFAGLPSWLVGVLGGIVLLAAIGVATRTGKRAR